MIKSAFINKMPALPNYKAGYRIIQLEPISMSGERFTIAVMTQSGEEHKVIQTISSKTLKCMYGNKFKAISSLIGIIIEDARSYLEGLNEIANWTPPFDGVFVGDTRNTRSSKGIDGVLFQAIASFSSLYQGSIVNDAMASLDGELEDDHETIRLLDNIKQAIAEPYRKNFSQKVRLLAASDITIDYLGLRYNANITNFKHSNAGSSLHRAKSKILDFELFRDERQKENINIGHIYELIIGCEDHPSEKVNDSIAMIIEMAEKKELTAVRESSAMEIAKRITRAETSNA